MALRKEDVDAEAQQPDKAKKRSRITFDVAPELRRRIKLAAVQENLSVGEYVSRILEEAVPTEPSVQLRGHPVTREAVERLRQTRKQIMEDRQGKPFSENSTEMLEKAREERTRELMGEE